MEDDLRIQVFHHPTLALLVQQSDKVKEKQVLPYCWVCKRAFIDTTGTDPSVIRNEHHVVPRMAGGTNGPTISVCSSHHDLLHLVAEKASAMSKVKQSVSDVALDIRDLLQGLTPQQRSRVIYLAYVVTRSFVLSEGDPNRKLQASFVYTADVMSKLDALKKVHGVSNRQKLVEKLIRQDYAKHFLA